MDCRVKPGNDEQGVRRPKRKGSRAFLHRVAPAALAAGLFACAPQPEGPPPRITLQPAAWGDLAGWPEDRQAAALDAFRKSCAVLLRRPVAASLGAGGLAGTAADWRPGCEAALAETASGDKAARAFFAAWFRPWSVTAGGAPDGLFTGYYEPELRGAPAPGGRYQVPLYGRPADLVTADLGRFDSRLEGQTVAGRIADGRLVPYPVRREIDDGALAGRAVPLVWVDNPIDAFFLHIQGSGRVTLPGGAVMRLGYAAHNGRPYTAIGRVLVERGALPRDRVSMQSIRGWLAANPAEARAVMARNDRYVFFRRLPGDAPEGAQGVALTPERSLAVDRRFLPLGVPLWVETRDPLDPTRPFRRLMVAQDTGGAIRGPVRGDIFFGHGRLAERRAGLMNQAGRYYLLLPKGLDPAS